MKAWLLRLFGADPRAVPPRTLAAARPPSAASDMGAGPPAVEAPSALSALTLLARADAGEAPLLRWLAGSEGDASPASGLREREALARLDRLISSAGAGSSLLPRSAAVVPKLLARLRGESFLLSDLCEQVCLDLTLVAEVLRMANSPFYRPAQAVVAVDQAIGVLGVDGLRKAIARAVLKPLMDAPGGQASALGQQRLREHADRKAQLCAALAGSLGLDAFEGYLLGLVHSAAWSVAQRTLDASPGHAPWAIDTAFAAALATRRDRLFGLIARQWQLSDALTRVAAEVASRHPDRAPSPQALLLDAGHGLASRLCGLGDGRASSSGGTADAAAGAPAARPAVGPEELLRAIGQPALACYQALAAQALAAQAPPA